MVVSVMLKVISKMELMLIGASLSKPHTCQTVYVYCDLSMINRTHISNHYTTVLFVSQK